MPGKILLVSYLFPPVGGIGVQRALSLAKYLPRCGYEIHVLKASNAGGPVQDPELTRQIPQEVPVYKAFTPEIPFAIRQKIWSRLSGGGTGQSQAAAGTSSGGWKRALRRIATRIMCPEPEILWVP